MLIPEKIKNNKYLILALVFTLFNMGAIFWFLGFQAYDDSSGYVKLIHWFQGKEVGIPSFRILTPLGPLIAVPFEFLGEGAGLIVQNILFYFFTAFLIFKIIELVFHNKEQAFLGVVLFTTALPVLFFGLSYMVDMGSWFFYILSIFITLLYLRRKDEKLIVFNGLLSSIGVLLKPNGGMGILFFIAIILLSKEFNLRDKFLKILKFGAVFLIPIIIFQIFTFVFFHFTSLDFYLYAETYNPFGTQPGSVYLHLGRLSSLIYVYTAEFLKAFGIVGLLFSLIGLWREWLHRDKERAKLYLSLLPFSFSFLIYTPTDSRFAFISTPLLILLATCGLIYLKDVFSGKKGKLAIYFLIIGYIASNYYFLTIGSYRLIILRLINYIK